MKNKKKLIPFIAIALMCIVFIFIDKITGEPLSVHTIIKYTPKDPILAAIVILLLYALKSLTVVFPLAILFFASGIIFPTWIAILINIIGLAITFTIPYWQAGSNHHWCINIDLHTIRYCFQPSRSSLILAIDFMNL